MDTLTSVKLPKVAIRFCVQCKWNLRAAYYAQELLQTFSNTLGEISLIPVTGGVFTIHLYMRSAGTDTDASNANSSTDSNGIEEHLVWDRKRDSGFPETKELKGRIRALVDPGKDMGHIDRALRKAKIEGGGRDGAAGDQKGSSTKLSGGTGEGSGTNTEHHHPESSETIGDCAECIAATKEDEARQ